LIFSADVYAQFNLSLNSATELSDLFMFSGADLVWTLVEGYFVIFCTFSTLRVWSRTDSKWWPFFIFRKGGQENVLKAKKKY